MRIFKKLLHIFYFVFFGSIKYARMLGVEVGSGCRLYIFSWGSEPFLVKLGNNVTVTSGVKFITHDGSTCLIKSSDGDRYQRYGEINIGNNVFIGVNTIIMPGVTIANNVVIGAGSVVTRSITESGVYIGSPCKKALDFDTYKHKIEQTCASNSQLALIKDYKSRVNKALEIQNDKK